MGQYFLIVNLDKREYIEPIAFKLWEICANNDIRLLGYLLATNNPDGTGIYKTYHLPPDEAKRKCEADTGFKCEVVYHNRKYKYTITVPKLKYFGRWCGDRIAIVGDYADGATNYDGPSFGHIEATFKNITEEVVKEFNWFIELEDLKVSKKLMISPDMVVSARGIEVNPKIR